MATLVLTAVGTAVGGPLGGALGALAGRTLDGAIFGGGRVEGARLADLAITTSSFGATIPKHFGKVRTAGTVIWATELREAKETSGGSKGQPKVTSYSYSASLAVAVGSNPILGIGRIWADGNLLRGAGGDLKVEGRMRFYAGTEDQQPDPLIASDVGMHECPGFRGLAYVVFEDLALGSFGNRIPALTFEVFQADGNIELSTILEGEWGGSVRSALPDMIGFSHSGGSFADMLQAIDVAWPLSCDGSNGSLDIRPAGPGVTSDVVVLPAPVVGDADEFGATSGFASERMRGSGFRQIALRYYDLNRDYQPGLQRSRARAGNGDITTVDLPATLLPDAARSLADSAAMQQREGRETISYRIAELDERFHPGALAAVPARPGLWRIEGWEWRHTGVELILKSVPAQLDKGMQPQGSSGKPQPAADLLNGPTALAAFGLPWSGVGDKETPRFFAAAASPAEGWRGAALYAVRQDGSLSPIGVTGKRRAVMGTVVTPMPAASPMLIDRTSTVTVKLSATDMALVDADITSLARGANTARIGKEIFQFGKASPLGDGHWKLSKLLRGRGGTEFATGGHIAGEAFVLLDDRLIELDAGLLAPTETRAIAALGNADPEPVIAALEEPHATQRPYSPVHGRVIESETGGIILSWTRRSRAALTWLDSVDVPLAEQEEAYDIRFIASGKIAIAWRSSSPTLSIDSDWPALSALRGHFEIRQIGQSCLSEPLILQPLHTEDSSTEIP